MRIQAARAQASADVHMRVHPRPGPLTGKLCESAASPLLCTGAGLCGATPPGPPDGSHDGRRGGAPWLIASAPCGHRHAAAHAASTATDALRAIRARAPPAPSRRSTPPGILCGALHAGSAEGHTRGFCDGKSHRSQKPDEKRGPFQNRFPCPLKKCPVRIPPGLKPGTNRFLTFPCTVGSVGPPILVQLAGLGRGGQNHV